MGENLVRERVFVHRKLWKVPVKKAVLAEKEMRGAVGG